MKIPDFDSVSQDRLRHQQSFVINLYSIMIWQEGYPHRRQPGTWDDGGPIAPHGSIMQKQGRERVHTTRWYLKFPTKYNTYFFCSDVIG